MSIAAQEALWRPWSRPGEAADLKIVRAEGCRVTDAQGRQYLDAAGGLWNVALGQRNETLLARMKAQIDALSSCSLFHTSNPPAEQLAASLVQRAGGLAQHVYLSTTGSSAVEIALRVARLHHRALGLDGKRLIVSFDKAYHGSSLLGLGAGGLIRDLVGVGDDLPPGFAHIPSPPDEAASLCALRELLEREAGRVACLILEPVLGSAGVLVPSRSFCCALNQLCREHEVLIVADEVATGAGRCGAFLASQRLGLVPDIVALSKGINSGYYPLGCTLMSRAVVEPIAQRQWPLPFGSTQDGNPVGCVTALATLQQIDEKGLEARATHLGEYLLAQLRSRLPAARVREVRGLGLMIGIELMHAHPEGAPLTPAQCAQVRRLCQDEGLLVYHFDSGISLFPALTLSDDEAADMLDILVDVIQRMA